MGVRPASAASGLFFLIETGWDSAITKLQIKLQQYLTQWFTEPYKISVFQHVGLSSGTEYGQWPPDTIPDNDHLFDT